MPILPKEIDIYPETLLDEHWHVDDTEAKWWVVYTLSRREKDLMRRLRSLEIPFYCPLVRRKSKSPSGRVRSSYVPLFPGYVFMRGTDEQRLESMTTNCISKTLEIHDAEELIHDLLQIRRLIDSDTPLTPESRIEPGALVRVKTGPFMGVEGTVIKRRNNDLLLVSVRFLQEGASVSLEDFQVEAI